MSVKKKSSPKQKSSEEKRPVGRPRTTLEDLPQNWEQIMVDVGQEGGSKVETMCMLGIGDSAWDTLLANHEEFRLAERKRKLLCEMWWERQGRKMAVGADGNATVWVFNMKNRFGWRDKHDHDLTSSDGSMKPQIIKIVSADADNSGD